MKLNREKLPALAILLATVALNMWFLRAELRTGGADLNDNVSHFRLIAGMTDAMQRGANPLDFWSPEWSLGFPLVRVYQPLAHLLVVLAWFALGKSVGLMTVFVWVRYLSLALLPVSFFAMARWIELPPMTAAAAALLSPLISTPLLYGLEYESYVWAGFGLFPQAVATHFLLLTLGLAFRALRRGGSATLAGTMLGLTFLCQFVYGYMGALSVCLLALLPEGAVPRAVRVRRVAWIGAAALLICAFQLAPLWVDRAIINPNPAEQAWKSDSYGAGQVLQWLVTGELLDHGRLPVLSLLVLAGVILLILRASSRTGTTPHSKGGKKPEGQAKASLTNFALAGAAFWILVFFGRPFWGPALWLLGVTPDLPLHRVLGGAQVFLVVLAAIGLSGMWSALSRRFHIAAAAALSCAIFYPMVAERLKYLDQNAMLLERTLQPMRAERQALDALVSGAQQRGGRVFAGLATANSWGPSFKIGAVPMYHVFAAAGLPTVGYLSHTMALTSGVVQAFDERKPAHYRLYNIQSFVIPAATKYPVPAFLKRGPTFGRFQIFDTPANGYFDLVDVSATQPVTRNDFLAANTAWLKSDGPETRRHLRLDFSPAPMPAPAGTSSPGDVASASQAGEDYRAEFDAARPAWALFKMAWHPNWKAYVDGQSRETSMLSPGFVGIPVRAGHHALVMRYEPGWWKVWMALVGILAVLGMAVVERDLSRVI